MPARSWGNMTRVGGVGAAQKVWTSGFTPRPRSSPASSTSVQHQDYFYHTHMMQLSNSHRIAGSRRNANAHAHREAAQCSMLVKHPAAHSGACSRLIQLLPMRPHMSRGDVCAAGISAVAEAPTTRTASPTSASTLVLEEAAARGEEEYRCVGAMLGAMCGNVLGAAVQNDRHFQVGSSCSSRYECSPPCSCQYPD